jgi:diguanylate cyclase (GGDEF)-like protein
MSDDVTEQVLIQQRVRRFADIVDRIDQALVVVHVDPEGELVLVAANPASEFLLQRPLGQLVGQPITDVFPTAAGSVMKERLQAVVSNGRSLEVDGIVVARSDDQPRVITLRAFPLPDQAAAISLLDVTDAEAAAEALRRQAHYDELTGLPNRRVLDEELHRAVRETPASGERVALLMMDLDQFKEVNDALGHHVGDQLLRGIGDRLSTVIDDALIARLGGDEFAVLLVGMIDDHHAMQTAQRVREALSEPFLVDDIRLQSNASIGIALFPDQAVDAAMLIQRADVAMYTAKRSGKGIAFYDPDHDRSSVARLTLSSDLPDAVAAGQLELHFQPFIDLRTGRTVRAEALVRWRHPTWGLLQPEEFVELAGLTGAIQPLTRWVFAEGIRAMATWRAQGHSIGLAVNLSVRNLYDPGLVDHLGDLLDRAGLDPFDLVVELTETELMDDARLAQEVFESLRALGVQTAIDDFGTGYSSMTFLRDLPLQEIKIDRSFVQHMHQRSDEFTIVRSMIDLGHNLGLEVVAEGVEHADHVELLIRLGCDLAQGYLFSRPLPLDDLLAWLEATAGDPTAGAATATIDEPFERLDDATDDRPSEPVA